MVTWIIPVVAPSGTLVLTRFPRLPEDRSRTCQTRLGELLVAQIRATFAARCLWAGVDLRTVQRWLGHSDMASTMPYLKPSRSQRVRDKVNEIFA